MNTTHYIGLDVHKKSVCYCTKLADGTIVAEGKVASRREDLRKWAKQLPQPWEGAMEATLFSGWIYDTLKPYAAKLEMAHPRMLEAITAAKKKSDGIDAGKLSDLLRVNLLPSCYVATPQIRELRRMLRYRNLVISEAVRMKNRISGLLMETGVEYNQQRLHGKAYFAELMKNLVEVPESVRQLLRLSRAALEMFEVTQMGLLKALRTNALLAQRVERLASIPGVGEVTALTWALEIAEPSRFPSIGLLRADDSAEQFGRQAETRTDQQAAQSTPADRADRSGQASAALELGVSSGARERAGVWQSQSGDAGSGSETGGLSAGGGPLRPPISDARSGHDRQCRGGLEVNRSSELTSGKSCFPPCAARRNPDLRTVLAGKGSLRRAKIGRALAGCGPFCRTNWCNGRLRRENSSGPFRGFGKLFRYCFARWLACGDLTAGPGLLWDCGKHFWCVSEHPPVSGPADLPKLKIRGQNFWSRTWMSGDAHPVHQVKRSLQQAGTISIASPRLGPLRSFGKPPFSLDNYLSWMSHQLRISWWDRHSACLYLAAVSPVRTAIAERQKAGRSSGFLEVTRLRSTTTSQST
jgi:transposase